MKTRPTPRTDEAFELWQEQDFPHDDEADPWLLASQLERELAESREECERSSYKIDQLYKALAEERNECKDQFRLLGMSGEREAALLAKVETLADACRWAQRELGRHTRPSPIDKALADLDKEGCAMTYREAVRECFAIIGADRDSDPATLAEWVESAKLKTTDAP